jgi:hypothetical protein
MIGDHVLSQRDVVQKPASRNFGLARHLTAANFLEADIGSASHHFTGSGVSRPGEANTFVNTGRLVVTRAC